MKRKLRNVLLGCGMALCLSFLIYPFLMSKAQDGQNQKQNKPQNENSQNQEQKSNKRENGLQAIKQIAAANRFYNILQEKEPEWTLSKASYLPPGYTAFQSYVVTLDLQKNKDKIHVLITECKSVEDAKRLLDPHVSSGKPPEICKGNECGDEGRKSYNYGIFSMGVRKDNFFVGVIGTKETSERFALYAINAIANE